MSTLKQNGKNKMSNLLSKQYMLRNAVFLFMLCAPIYSGHSQEPWIDANDLFSIKINMTTDQVIEKLGPPLYLEAQIDEDDGIITKKLFYNFRTKKYKAVAPNNTVIISESDMLWGRTSVVQFAFIDDQLINWEEDNLTLNMAKLDKKNGGTLIKYFGFLLNIILTIKVFSM